LAFKDYLLKEIDNLRDRRSQTFTMFFALISGSIAMIVYVLTGDKPIFSLLIALVGFIVSIFAFAKGNHSGP
jgi:VIT1/CCC1 family predicted Fe2+/Mn2+ transporter